MVIGGDTERHVEAERVRSATSYDDGRRCE